MTTSSLYDQVIGPKDGTVELILFQPEDWEGDPLLIKALRKRIRAVHEYTATPEFLEKFNHSQPLIVVQGEQFPPEEIYDLLVKQEVEFRIGKVKKERPAQRPAPGRKPRPRMSSSSSIPVVATEKPASKQAAKPAAKPAPKPKAKPAAKPAPKPATAKPKAKPTAKPVQKQTRPATAQPRPAQARPAQQTRPKVVEPAPKPPAPEPEPWEVDSYDDLDAGVATGQGSSTGFIVGLVFTVLFALLTGYGLLQSMSTAPPPSLKSLDFKSVNSDSTQHNTYASVTITPDRGTLSVIPIQDRKSQKPEYFVLFAAKGNKSLLVFVPQAKSQILSIKMVEDPTDPLNKKATFVWAKKFSSLSFSGTLEKLQRAKNGPLELRLPDGFKDVNKQYNKQGINFPNNAMVLKVDQKPPAPSNNGGIIALIGLVLTIVAGFASMVQKQKADRSF